MKLLLVFLLSISVLNVWASKSRMESLQGDSDGSFFIDDHRNIFLNPAYLTRVESLAMVEWGTSGTAQEVDAIATPKAEGGLLYSFNEHVFGFYLGHEDEDTITYRNSLSSNTVLRPDNTISLFYGKKIPNLELGTSFEFSTNDRETALTATTKLDRSETFMKLKSGVYIKDKSEVFLHLKLIDKAKGGTATNDKYKGKIGVTVGGSHKIDRHKFFIQLDSGKFEWKRDNAGQVTTTDGKATLLELGYSLHVPVRKKKGRFIFTTSFNHTNTKQERTGFKNQEKFSQLGLIMGLEEKIKSWLTLRASLGQGVVFNSSSVDQTGQPDLKSSNANTSTVAVGFTTDLKPFSMDASLTTGTGTITTDNILTRVSLRYYF